MENQSLDAVGVCRAALANRHSARRGMPRRDPEPTYVTNEFAHAEEEAREAAFDVMSTVRHVAERD